MPCEDKLDPVIVAKAAGLRYVSDANPGIRRKRAGKNFRYTGLDGKPIHDQEELKRFRSLGIHLPGPMYGYAPGQMDTFRRRGVTRKGVSSTATILAGAR